LGRQRRLSTDNGTSWTAVNSGLPYAQVNSLLFSGTNLFAGTSFGGIILSSNNGTSWTSVDSGLTISCVLALAVSGTNLFAVGNESNPGTSRYGNGVFLSTNNGTSWTQTSLNNKAIQAIAVSGTNLVVSASSGGRLVDSAFVFLSTNNGTNWSAVDTLPPYTHFNSLVFSGTNLFAGNYAMNGGVYLSTTTGTSWTPVYSDLTDLNVHALAVSGVNLFAGTGDHPNVGGGVFLSTNNGTSWIEVNTGLTNTSVYALTVNGTNLFTGTNGSGVWRRPLSEMIPTTDSLLVPVAGGTFTAGTSPVTISSFKIDKYEVTYELWTSVRDWALTHGYTDMVAGQNGCSPVGTNNPVTMVNWYDII
jgi:hypothetical protein